jgi:hypothetical protein
MNLQLCLNVMISPSFTGNFSITPADRRRQEAITQITEPFSDQLQLVNHEFSVMHKHSPVLQAFPDF